MHPAELSGVGAAIFLADYRPAVQEVLDRDEQQADQNQERGDFLVETEEKSFNLEVIVHEPLEDLPEKGQRMGQTSIWSHDWLGEISDLKFHFTLILFISNHYIEYL